MVPIHPSESCSVEDLKSEKGGCFPPLTSDIVVYTRLSRLVFYKFKQMFVMTFLPGVSDI